MNDSNSPAGEFFAKYPRKIGAAMSIVSAAIVYWQLIFPFQEVERGAREITASMKFGAVAIILLLLGTSYTLFGAKAARFFRPQPGDSKVLCVIVCIAFGLVAFGVAVAVHDALEAKGYVFSF